MKRLPLISTCSFLITLLLIETLQAQIFPLNNMINKAKSSNIPFDTVRLFSYTGNKMIPGKGIYDELNVNNEVLAQVLQYQPLAITLKIPIRGSVDFEAEMVKQDMGNPRIKLNNTLYATNVSQPVIYRGIAKGIEGKTSIMLTINENYVSFYAALNNKDLFIEKENNPLTDKFILYNTSEIQLPVSPISCGTIDISSSIQPQVLNNQILRPNAPQDKCVYVFVDCSFGLFQNRSSNVQTTVNYIYALFNDIGTAYRNEQINVKISEINVWTQTDPFRHNTAGSSSRDSTLKDFAAFYQDNFWGNIAVCADWTNGSRSGLAGGFGKAKGELPYNCPTYAPANGFGVGEFCYTDLNYFGNYQNFPTPANAQQVYLITHEMGHLLGSRHTHWCGWVIDASTNPPTLGALDNCATTEGGCAAGAAPTNGGTYMSYCVGAGQYMNFNNGFGTQPGNVIRDFVDKQACILNCPPCPIDAFVGNLDVGPNRIEASNTITANGILPFNSFSVLDAGAKVTLSPGFRSNNGARLKIIINGCGGIR